MATPTASSVSNVLPTYNATTTIVVELAESATPSDNGKFTIFVNESDGISSSSIDVYVSVAVVYNPHLDATGVGDQGLLAIEPGQSVDLSIPVSNFGSVTDSYLLGVGEEPVSADGGPTIPPVVLQTQQHLRLHGRPRSVMSSLLATPTRLRTDFHPCSRNSCEVRLVQAIPRILQAVVGRLPITGMT